MKSFYRAGLVALVVAGAASASNRPALAWGCVAESDQGTKGYSQSFDTEQSARDWAMNECSNRSGEGETCEITECDVNS